MKAQTFIYVTLAIIVAIAAGIIAIIVLDDTPAKAPVDRNPDETAADVRLIFPLLEGTNLLQNQLSIPDDTGEEIRLMVVAYDRKQKSDLDDWVAPADNLMAQYPALSSYFLLLLPQNMVEVAPIIIKSVAGATDEDVRERTIIVFTDVEAFNDIVNVTQTDDVALFLLDANDRILWQGSGAYDDDIKTALEPVFQDVTAN